MTIRPLFFIIISLIPQLLSAKTCITIVDNNTNQTPSASPTTIEFRGSPISWGYKLVLSKGKACFEIYHQYKITTMAKGNAENPIIYSTPLCVDEQDLDSNVNFSFDQNMNEKFVQALRKDDKLIEVNIGCYDR